MAKSPRVERVLRNMTKLAEGGATPEESLVYLKSEGYSPKTFAEEVTKFNTAKGVIADFGPVRAALQGLSFGFSDEAEAGLKALIGRGSYEENLAQLSLGKEQFYQESPGTAISAEIAGGLPLMALGGLGALRTMQTARSAIPMAAQIPRSVGASGGAATAGAATGGLAGAGSADPGQRMQGAKTGAQLGAALGVGGQAAVKVVPKIPGVQEAIDLGRRAVGLPTDYARRADVKLLQALQRDGIDLPEAERRVTLIKQGGYKPETIIELGGENTRRLADIVAQYPGATQLARELSETRRAGAPERIVTDFREAFRVKADAFDLADDIVKARDAASKPLYQQAYREGGVIDDPRIMDFMKIPQFKDAYGRARRIAALDGIELPPDPTQMGQVGGFDLMTLDYIKRGLDDVLFTGKQPGSGIGKTELGKLKQKRNEFVGIVDDVGPESYKAARQAFAGPTEVLDAIEQGKKFTQLDPRELNKIYSGLSQAEKDGFRVGVYDSIKTNIEKGADGSDVLRRVWSSDQKRSQLQVLLGDDAFRDLSNQLSREKVIRQTDVSIVGGSQTQPRTLAQREFEGQDELIPMMAERGIGSGLRNYLLRTATGPGQPTAEQLAKTLFSLDLPTQQTAIQRLQSLDEILAREAARSAGAVGTAGGLTGLLGD